MGNEGSKGRGGRESNPPGTSSVKSALGIKSQVRKLQGIKQRYPSSSLVQKHLENARKTRVLQLKQSNLKKVPEQLAEVAEILRNLDMSQNRIKELPAFIGGFVQLRQLHLNENALEELPDEIGQLKNLETLNVANNHLQRLPDSFAALNSLKILNLSTNKFSFFPVVVTRLVYIDTVDLSTNTITELPDEIRDLKAMELNMNQNRLGDLNGNLVHCPRLKVLRVEENCLQKTAFTKELLENSPIALIAFAGNLFQDRDFQGLNGYSEYQQRFTATKRKM